MYGKLLSSTHRPNLFPTYVWHFSPKFNNWRGRMNAFISHGFLSIAHRTLLFWACPLAGDRVTGPPSPPRAITFVCGGRVVPVLAFVVHRSGWFDEMLIRADLSCWWHILGGHTADWRVSFTLCLCSCVETSQFRACSQGSLGWIRGLCTEKNCSGTDGKMLLAVAERLWRQQHWEDHGWRLLKLIH